MVGTARLHGNVDGGVSQIDVVVGAIIGSFNDVGTVLGEDAGDPVQSSGIIRQMDAQAHQASIFDQAAFDDARQQSYIDVATAHNHGDFLAGLVPNHRNPAIDDRSYGSCSGSFGQNLLALQQQQDGVGNLLFFNRDDLVHILLDERERALARAAHRDPVGDGHSRRQGHGLPLGKRNLHRRQPHRLNSNDLDARIRFFQGATDAADQPTPADGHDDRLQIGMLLKHFQP